MSLKTKWTLLIAGVVSGAIWFLVALAFDKGVRDFNYPVIPTSSPAAVLASLLAAVVTGVCITFVFRRSWSSRSRAVLWVSPPATLVTGLTMFGVLTWMVWLVLGERTGITPSNQLANTVGFFVIYGAFSPLFAPFLYGLAFLNQSAIREILRRAT